MRKIILLIGKPCAGKSARLSEFIDGRHDYDVLCVSDLLKKARENGELRESEVRMMDSGKLVPNYVIINTVLRALRKTDNNVIIDGFPRTVEQAEDILESGIKLNKVIHLYIDDEVAFLRARDRIVCEKCGRTYLPKKLKYMAPNKYVIPIKDGICNYCQSKLVRRADDEESILEKRLETYDKETIPAIEKLQRNGVPVITVMESRYAGEKFKQAIES